MFYLTVEELFAFVEGRAVTNNLSGLVELRRSEYDGYRKVGRWVGTYTVRQSDLKGQSNY